MPMRGIANALSIVLIGVAGAAAAGSEHAVAFVQKRDALAADDVDGRMALAAWAEQSDLEQQAAALYARVLELQPDHPRAYERWVAIADTTELPPEDDRIAALKQDFPAMRMHLTRHFIILFDTDERWARTRAGLLEKAHDVYYATFRRVDFRPLPLRQRLVCILFNSHRDYVDYALKVDNAKMGWSAGYYSTRTNRIVYFDDRDSPIFRQVVEKKQQLEQRVDELRDRIRNERNHAIVAQLRRELDQTTRQLTWYRNRHEALAKLGNASKTVHEAVHQLAFNSRLQARGTRYPFWISEGLATNFETDNPASPFGPLHPNDLRRAALQQHIRDGGAMVPLDQFVTITRVPAEDQQQAMLIYNQGWALFGYLFRYHRDELRQYLDAAVNLPPGERSAEQLHEDFVEAFGPTEPIQKKFTQWVNRLK